MSKWLSVFRRDESPVPAPSAGTGVSLPAPITAHDIKNSLRQQIENRPRLVVGFDATASREAAWDAFSKPLQDKVLTALPGALDVALAVHGGSRLHTFTEFTADPGALRDVAAGVRCRAGTTRLLDILERVAALRQVRCVLYVGDVFEESRARALRLADRLLLNGTRVIILHDTTGYPPARGLSWGRAPLALAGAVIAGYPSASGYPSEIPILPGDVFGELAERTGGAVLPFDPSSLVELGELLQAVAVLTAGGEELLKAKAATMPAATLLLEHLVGSKAIGGRR